MLRSWRAADAPLLKRAIDESLEHLRPWMPWALSEPTPLEALAKRLEGFAAEFAAGKNWLYGIFTPDERAVLGAAGLHPRIGPAGLEIGYWIRSGATRRRYATEAAYALTVAAFGRPDVERVEIHCDPRNLASAGIPRVLGYRLAETLRNNTVTPDGAPRDTMVWRVGRAEWTARAPASIS
ncbi:MAG: GNAT family N-acetyltransferase [Hyphomicrobiales bacterium]